MSKRYIDRGSLLRGQDKTSRDSRVPFNFPRSIENYALPDKRARRRRGYGSVHEHVRTQALAKHTGVSVSRRQQEYPITKNHFMITPLSYGVIRWQEYTQLRTTKSTTVEFMLRVGEEEQLVKNPQVRMAHYETGGSPATGWGTWQLRQMGVLVYDQTLLSNNHRIENTIVTKAGAAVPTTQWDLDSYRIAAANNYDVFPLTALAVGFTSTYIFCEFTLVDSLTFEYWRCESLLYTLPSYVPGAIYHIAIVHDHAAGANGEVYLYIDGNLRDTFVLPAGLVFAGEYDHINKIAYASGQKRDIVLLNECTARASYQSACKFDSFNHGFQTFHHGFGASGSAGIAGLIPWAQSPPRGTAMWDLRIWNEARSGANITAWKNKRILSTDAGMGNLAGNWHLNDGGPVCKNHVTGSERHYCTVHHGYPGYVDNSEMLHGIGLMLRDGQHIIRSYGAEDRDLGIGVADKLGSVFNSFNVTADEHRAQNDFTVQIQVTVPDAFSVELNDQGATAIGGAGSPTRSYDLYSTESRRPIYFGLASSHYLKDGRVDAFAGSGVSQRRTCHYFPHAVGGSHMAYDMTLWSIEGTQLKEALASPPAANHSLSNEPDRRRIPVARGLITPAGKVAFELFKEHWNGGSAPQICRLVSNTTLTIGKTYTITFVQRARYVWTGGVGNQSMNASGWNMEIWIEDVTAGTAAAKDVSYPFLAEGATQPCTFSQKHHANYDIIVGASYVNSGWDFGIQAGAPAGGTIQYGSYKGVGGTDARGGWGPWPVTQHFMSPFQDQPLNGIVGFFRLWSLAINEQDIDRFGTTSIKDNTYGADLLFNLELDEITGVEIPNRSKYPDKFSLGYKGWGDPQGHANLLNDVYSDGTLWFPRRMYDAPWAFEDCLGYLKIDSEDYDARQAYTTVRGILPMKSSFAEQYGVVAIYDGAAAFDETVSGTYAPLYLSNHGLMSEMLPNQDWYGTVVGNRLIMTSAAALPKVFDGKIATVAGFKKWTGGTPVAYTRANIVGALSPASWYGVCYAYWSEDKSIYHLSPVIAVYAAHNHTLIDIFNIPQHPDPRVSIKEFYRTAPQQTEYLALNAPLYKTRIRYPFHGNSNSPTYVIEYTEGDAALPGAILDRNITEMPVCKYSAALNERLYLAGDPADPDIVYFTDAGNPERIDKLVNSLEIPEGSGDTITGMVSAFGAIYIFKPNAVWRLDDLGGNQHQFTKVSGIGAVGQKAIAVIVDPDSGRTLIFFWSYHGPYVFDGSTASYIGQAIEESTVDGSSSAQYNWLDPVSVVVAHNAVAREVMCIYSPKVTISDVTTDYDRVCKAVVFNYRSGSWVTFNGLPGAYALSLNYTASNIGVSVQKYQDVKYSLLLGSINGKIYEWGTTKYDAVPAGFTPLANKAVSSRPAAGRFVVSGLTVTTTEDLLDCWVTFVDTSTGDWVTCPIIATDVTGNYIEVDTVFYTDASFDPDTIAIANLSVYICQPPASVEFPWDELEQPFFDKHIVRLITWHDQAHRFKMLHNYDNSTVIVPWTDLTDSNSQRKRTMVKTGKCEAVKLHLMSHDLDAAIDAIAYEVAPMFKGVTPQ